jgi:hypothetical protein
VHPLALYDQVIAHRITLLSKFGQLEEHIFHEPIWPETWPCEGYFRHLLAGMKWMVDAIPSVPPVDYHHLAIRARDRVEQRASYRDVRRALTAVTRETRAYLVALSAEDWAAPARNAPGLSVEEGVIGLLEHEIEHHGMIRWILKRYTQWDDSEMYGSVVP